MNAGENKMWTATGRVMAAYDWAWREDGQPMTFLLLFREAIEICSPELYQRRAVAQEIIDGVYAHGLIRDLTADRFQSNREAYRWLMRLVAQAFVRAYLRERRAGLRPRERGIPAGTRQLVEEAMDAVKTEAGRVRARQRELDARKAAQMHNCPHCGQRMPVPR